MSDNRYKCIECEKEFSQHVDCEEKCGLDTPPYYHYKGCPYCHGEYYVRKKGVCGVCNTQIWEDEKYYKISDNFYCENCVQIIN